MNNLKEAKKICNEISDINKTAIKALENEKSCGGLEVVTVLKYLREKLCELYAQLFPEEKTA